MSLIVRLEQEVREAMLARDTARRDALRLILSSLKSAEKDLQRPLSDEEELQVLQRERKKRREAAEAFHESEAGDYRDGGGEWDQGPQVMLRNHQPAEKQGEGEEQKG